MADDIKFGTDGWRAIIGEKFTYANVERVAFAIGSYIKEAYGIGSRVTAEERPILIGYDTRFMADKFAERIASVLASMGLKAKVTERDVPTPCIAYAAQLEPTAGAVQVTASHNPPEYCGIKYIPDFGGPATTDITNAIVSHLGDLPPEHDAIPTGDIERFDPQPPYMKALEKLVDLKRIGRSKLRIAYDALFSTSRGYLDKLLEDAGLYVVSLHDWRDPLFGGGMPEPKPQYLADLITICKAEEMDVGIATDGDADRFAIIDDNGEFLTPNQILCLLTRHLVKNHGMKGALVRTVGTTHLLDKLAERYGLHLIETPVGFKWIGEKMRTEDVLIGGEESGGLSIKGHIPEKDGILANLLILEMIVMEGKPLSEIWSTLQSEIGLQLYARRGDMHLSEGTQKALMKRLTKNPLESLGGEKVTRVSDLDGLKLYTDDNSWLLIRPSGTEPLFRLTFESTSEERLDRMANDFDAQVEEILKEIAPPGTAAYARG